MVKLKVDRDALLGTISKMKSEGWEFLVKITAVDYKDHVDVLYIIRDLAKSKDEILEVTLQPTDLWLPTIFNIHQSADWYERELSEMFGVEIKGRLVPRLFLEKWDGIDPPLRKSFVWDSTYRTSDDKQ
jgi:NADH:ubiquinone oxidoreductase subunit C